LRERYGEDTVERAAVAQPRPRPNRRTKSEGRPADEGGSS
jgi:hypothetical protein